MDKSKIKNFIIILLALVNVFLLAIVISGAREKREADASRKEALENVLAEKGLTLNPDIALPDNVPSLLSLQRDMDTENRRISALIGKCSPADQGGNSYFYDAPDGQATFRGTGEFEIKLKSGVISKGRNPVDAAKSVLKKMGLECSNINPIVEDDGGNTKVTLYCSWDKTAIYNAKIIFDFTSDYLWLVSGIRPLDLEHLVQSSEDYPDSVTIIMNFLEYISDTGYVCNEITNLKIEYSMNSTVSGNCVLKPVWCVETNSGSYYIDAQTGKAENIAISS